MAAGQFRFCITQTEEEKKLCYKLRYQVYVEEFGFESADEHPDGLEMDQWDEHSVHILVTETATGAPAGTARIIRHSPIGLPVEHIPCQLNYPEGVAPLPEESIEISRFVVAKPYRRGFGRKAYGTALHNNDKEAMKAPEMMLGIIAKIFWTLRAMKSNWVYLVTEDKVIRACHSYGFGSAFFQLGPEVDYHGPRTPYVARLTELLAKAKEFNPMAVGYTKTREKVDTEEGKSATPPPSPSLRSEQQRNSSTTTPAPQPASIPLASPSPALASSSPQTPKGSAKAPLSPASPALPISPAGSTMKPSKGVLSQIALFEKTSSTAANPKGNRLTRQKSVQQIINLFEAPVQRAQKVSAV